MVAMLDSSHFSGQQIHIQRRNSPIEAGLRTLINYKYKGG
jgi:hypothetical protein